MAEADFSSDENRDDALTDLPQAAPGDLNLAPQDAPAPDDEGDAADEPEDDTVTLLFEGAFFVNSYVVPLPEGGTLEFNRSGTDVPADDADQIIADAAANGVTLTRKAN